MLSLLFVDDDEKELAILSQVLPGFITTGCPTAAEGLRQLSKKPFDLVLLDLDLPDMNGFAVLSHIRAMDTPPPVVMLSAFGRAENVVRALRLGAENFIEKPYSLKKLSAAIDNALLPIDLPPQPPELPKSSELTGKPEKPDPLAHFKGNSRLICSLKEKLRVYARSEEAVLIYGESGTGKELLARAVHDLSSRRKGPFQPIHAGAIPENLIETEFFGSDAGAFTDARSRPGYLERSSGGTFFLDEIGEMPRAAQMKLLRILEDGSLIRIGGRKRIPIDIRLISATHRILPGMIEEGSFRLDLYHRINTLTVTVPPLRRRIEDIPELSRCFLGELGVDQESISAESMEKLSSHHWPGNVRELRNTIRRAAILAEGKSIEPRHIVTSAELSA